jgi:DsbC/DsbD-like thiol-disulfide interchange protein
MTLLDARSYGWTLVLASLFAASVIADNPAPGKKSDSVVKVTATPEKPDAGGKQIVSLKIEVNKGWHIYANPVGDATLEPNATTVKVSGKGKPKLIRVDYPEGKLKQESIEKTTVAYKVYEGTVTIKATVQRAANDREPLSFAIELNACKEGKCLMPGTVRLTVP